MKIITSVHQSGYDEFIGLSDSQVCTQYHFHQIKGDIGTYAALRGASVSHGGRVRAQYVDGWLGIEELMGS
jgi:hypothetical protein